jgi:FkbM family methyltransferase
MRTLVSRLMRATRRLVDLVRWRGATRTVLQGPAAGLRIGARDASADYAEGTNERPVQDALTRLLEPGDTFFDVGANVGFFSLLAARLVGREGRVVAFEAVPHIAARLAANARINGFSQIEVVGSAVGATPGRKALHVTDHPGGATLAEDSGAADIVSTTEVDVVSLDVLVESGSAPSPDVIKIDVEGYEAAVLAGMRRLLLEARPRLIVELDAPSAGQLADKRGALERELGELGYDVDALPDSYTGTNWHVVHVVATAR